jgi:hypothetical protein
MPITALSPWVVFRWFVPAVGGSGLVPAAGYKAKWFEAGTTTAKAIYDADDVIYPSPSNTAILNSEGFAVIKLGPGGYKLQVTRPDDSVVHTQDNIIGVATFGTGFAASIAELRTINTNVNTYTYVAGYYVPGDGGGGMFFNETSAAADDGGYIIASTYDASKRWFRIDDDNGDVRAASFGFIQDTGSIQTVQLQAADAYAAASGFPLRIAVGSSTAQIDAMTFNAPEVIFNGRGLRGVLAVPAVVFNGLVKGLPLAFLFERMTVTLANPAQAAHPEWWDAKRDGVTDDLAKINAMFASGAEEFVFSDGDYEVTAPPTYPAGGLIKSYGTVTEGATVHIQPGFWQRGVDGLIRTELLKVDEHVVGSLNVETDVVAGSEAGPGLLKQRVGSGATDISPAVSTYNMEALKAGKSATGAAGPGIDLMSKQLDLNSLVDSGDAIRLTAGGSFSGTILGNDTLTLFIYLDGTVIATLPILTSNDTFPNAWFLEAIITNDGASPGNILTSSSLVTNSESNPATNAMGYSADFTAIGKNLATDLLIQMRATENGANPLTTTQYFMLLEYIKAR